jgi:hypothetical protein
MEVFVLMGEFSYESHHVLGVYESFEAASVAHGVYLRDEDRHFDYYYVMRRNLGAPVDDTIDIVNDYL